MAESDAPAQTADQAAPPSGIKRLMPLILGTVIGLSVGVGTGFMVVGPMASKSLGFNAPSGNAAHADDEEEDAEADSIAAGKAPVVYTLDNLVLNPAGSNGARFLLVTVAFECVDAAAVTALQTRDAELRDVVLTTLGRKSVEELIPVASRDSIKTELAGAINTRFGKKAVTRLYFPQFVVQ